MNNPVLLSTQHHGTAWSFVIERSATTMDAVVAVCHKLGLSERESAPLLHPFATDAYPFARTAGSVVVEVFVEPRWVVLVIDGAAANASAIVRQVCDQHERPASVAVDFAELRKELVELYARYIEDPDDDEVCCAAYDRAHDLLAISPVLPHHLRTAVNALIAIGARLDNRPSVADAKEILTELQASEHA